MLGDRVRAHAAPCLRLLRLLRHAGAIGGVHALSAELAGSDAPIGCQASDSGRGR